MSLSSSTCLHDNVDSVDDAGNVPKDCEQDVDEDICTNKWLNDSMVTP